MALPHSPKIVTDGLVLCLDAANTKSYPGTGTTWFDVSGNGRNFSIDPSFATWDSSGYFTVTSKTGYVFSGPASNTFGFASTNEHTVISWVTWTTKTNSAFFDWRATQNTGSDSRAIYTHFPYNTTPDFYYDVSGCCGTTQRISGTVSNNFQNSVNMATWRTRKSATPNRQFFRNGISILDSGANSTATVTWNNTTAVGLCGTWVGRLYNFYVYNRDLTDAEITQNFNALRGRYGL
jgi:hypothetical protein